MAVSAPVRAEWVEYPSEGATIRAYFALPDGAGPWPGIVMIHENPGLTEHRQEVTRRLAGEGYAVLTPNLFSRIGGASPDDPSDLERKRQIALATPDEQVFADVMNGCGYLRGRAEVRADRLGLIGFCMGGSKVLYTATHTDAFRCYVAFYGPVKQRAEVTPDRQDHSYLPYIPNLSGPLLYHVGDQDTACPMDEVEQLRQALAEHGKTAEIHVYPGALHAFHDDRGPRHHPEAAALAWERTLPFFARYLQS
jgi:carboxymethylenebutenolidase